ncbi:hypothetical protein [Oceanobacillus kapialis]|uniref:Uncharacterized protein n=1 Tax=Oceanobacillus kapialis TaxID=481353 RepID=A0ABW5Q3W9_9BACI
MTYFVAPSNYWVGYHMVEHLLGIGHEVHGKEEEAYSSELPFFFGRNSAYKGYNPNKKYKRAFLFKNYDENVIANSAHVFEVCGDSQQLKGQTITAIHIPLLFGEWMPMDDKGMYWNNSYVRFTSNFFQEEAIYVKDFIQELLKWESNEIRFQEKLYVHSFRSKEKKELIVENSIYLRDNVPIDEKLQQVRQHYKQYKQHYENI